MEVDDAGWAVKFAGGFSGTVGRELSLKMPKVSLKACVWNRIVCGRLFELCTNIKSSNGSNGGIKSLAYIIMFILKYI